MPRRVQVQLRARLAQRQRKGAADCVSALEWQAESFMQGSICPVASTDELPPGSYYLELVDSSRRRTYLRVAPR